jgi:GNAT superfamily N-acetyltransferase
MSQIKVATPADTPLVLTFIRELGAYQHLAHEVVITETQLRDALSGASPRIEAIIAYVEQEPVGFALFFHDFSTFTGTQGLYVEDIYVRPVARGQGIGKQLLAYVAQLAKRRACTRLEWSVLNWNETAIDFYKRLGAKAMDEWTVYKVTGGALDALAAQGELA